MKFDLRVEECPSCKKNMMYRDKDRWYGVFPMQDNNCQDAQMKSKGVVYISDSEINNELICIECEEAGKATFTCTICHQVKNSRKLEESFGDRGSYLCSDCYSTIPAKSWDDTVDILNEKHKYDFE